MNDHKSGFRKFLLLWMGELISSIGGGLTSFGLAVYVFNETGSAASMAVVSLLAFLPTLLLSVPAGVLADRHDRRLLMMIGDGFSGLGIVYILLCMLGGGASLLQICIGVSISSVFSALLEPSYRATITEMLTEEEYSKASGMVSLAGSARYLVSPVLAGLLLAVSDIKLLLFIDICTFAFTVITTAVVKKGIVSRKPVSQESFFSSIADGWKAITEKKGLFVLIMVSSLITCFMGMVVPGSSQVVIFGTMFITVLANVGVDPMLAAAMLPCICGVMCGITPPLGLGMYAGMTLAESDFTKTFNNNLFWVAAQFILQVVILMGWLPILGL